MSETSEQVPWWHSGVVYQVYPRSFADSDGDGVGDLGGIIAHLDHLQRLGVDAVWLSPVYASPMVDMGYDISDYQSIAPEFGDLAQMDELIEQAHARGIRIVMDLVVNHTSDQHPWFVESRSSTDNPKRDWYWWRSPREGAEPTTWQSFFSGPAWTLDEATGEYYLHLFAPEQPDLNWENPEVREAVYAMMRWWLDRGVDGFRMDVINMISKRLVDGEPQDGPTGALDGGVASQSLNGPRVHEFLAEMRREVFEGRTTAFGETPVTIGETPVTTVEHGRLYTDPRRGELDMVFTFEHVDLDGGPGGKWDVVPVPLPTLKATLAGWQEGLEGVGWNSLYWSNHDQPRVVSRYGDDSPQHRVASATALATVLHLHRGTAFVYQGEEIGMGNAPWASVDDFRDLESVNHFHQAVAGGADPERVMAALRRKSRDNARTPVQWDDSPHAGFTTGEPWLPVNPDHAGGVTVDAQEDDTASVLAHYRRVIALRHDDPVVAHGDFTLLLPEHEQLWAFTRSHQGATLTVVANLSGETVDPVAAGVPLADVGAVVLDNEGGATSATAPLGPWAARVLRS
ncbi:alpha-glucosidase [Nocardioides marmoraquaticus]